MSKNDKKETIAQKMERLDKGIEWFYGDDFRLDEATEKYRETLGLAEEIEKELSEMKNEIKVIEKDFSV